ncbi:DNA topoisomerase IB [Roseitranquillus sediminis]|uniref:DNA topoisomerase IB n=1 Tax=Roseitranquillus sediminis TaxID=2809051 RepID=UPI001D0C71E2|nr:DNA topoisomerase IB [Roseitranquillus sediminis]MBM9593491.1 DNA topoisomerase IB [Roseitranquillus sediminis]
MSPIDALRDSASRLVYYPDDRPGITRRRCGRGFSYVAPDGTRIDDVKERRRLESMAVPPAYRDVWMSPRRNGHLQATGFDARERKQYRYHPEWTEWRARRKFDNLADFGRALPRLRRHINEDLSGEAGEKTFAIAAVVALLDRAALRIGHPENVVENGTYGATTLTSRHVALGEGEIRLNYPAKGGRKVNRTLRDKRLNKVFHALDDLPGKALMSWIDRRGESHAVSSEDVNDYIARIVGEEEATAKTFRTWAGTVCAFEVAVRSDKASIKAMSQAAAERLANTPTIARNSYIHPQVIALSDVDPETRRELGERPSPVSGLRKAEGALLAFLGG